jgi:tyrosine-protein kinase Etk/Wzc
MTDIKLESMAVPAVGASHLLMRLSNYRRFLLIVTLFIGGVVGVLSMLSSPIYTAYARLLPPQTNTSTASAQFNQVGGGALLGASALTLKNPSELYASLFYSRAVQDNVIARFKLAEHYKISDADLLRTDISKRTKVEVGKDGIITLAYTDKTASNAADIANGMIDAMYQIAQRLAKEEAERRSEFYISLVAEAQSRLAVALEELRVVEKETNLTRLKGQEEASVSTLMELQGLISTREVELKKMLVTATEQHPEIVRVKSEVASLRAELQRLFANTKRPIKEDEKANPKQKADRLKANSGIVTGLLFPFNSYADSRAKVEPLRTAVESYANVLSQLIRAQALSRIDETRDFAGISILDVAVPPTHKSGPRVGTNTFVGLLIGFLVATMLAVAWDILFTDPSRKARWRSVYRSFLRRGR